MIGDKVIVGVAGADHGIRGFVAAFRAGDGSLIWRRWTIPMHNEPGGDTWQGPEPLLSGGSTWLTGSYDPATATLYWPTGNPYPDSNDRDRPGDNLFTDCILALNVDTGQLKWHYQFTPHDLKDRDATEPPVLIDTVYQGVPRKLLIQANRNGFFYVFDRRNGERLLAKPFLKRVDWASSIGPNGRPVVVAPKGCPSDAANWDPAAFSPITGLYYFIALEECTGEPTGYPDQTGQRYLRALNIETGQTFGRFRNRDPRTPKHGAAYWQPPAVLCSMASLMEGSMQWISARENALAFSDQCSHEGAANYVYSRRRAVRCRRGRPEHSLFWSVKSFAFGEGFIEEQTRNRGIYR